MRKKVVIFQASYMKSIVTTFTLKNNLLILNKKPITWILKKQTTVTLSSTKVEYNCFKKLSKKSFSLDNSLLILDTLNKN
jgi:hypothetical protein